jgi:uncharacterized membrane protein
MSGTVCYGWWIALISLCVGYSLLAHYTNAVPGNETLGALVAIAPILLALVTMAWHSQHRTAMLSAIAVALVATAIAWHSLESHFTWIYWIEHAGTQLIFCLLFARSLAPGREPLCSLIARLVHGTLSPAILRYTRQITVAWMTFFGLMSATSTMLFFAAPLTTWSAFVNFFTGPLICLMFVVEYVIRRMMFPDVEHVHIMVAVRAVRKMYG